MVLCDCGNNSLLKIVRSPLEPRKVVSRQINLELLALEVKRTRLNNICFIDVILGMGLFWQILWFLPIFGIGFSITIDIYVDLCLLNSLETRIALQLLSR